ncbi:MAG: chloride channel protein [Cyanobacteria bacterium SZAS LIN-3]|nr:chloride channel protein [Cyanobacteria bacterium SZAS LIN-3]MBS2009230.1 chloride channel protein [Cyanobacteria bacterium SZAS TMP-1]
MRSNQQNYIPILESCVIGLVAGLSAVLLSAGVSWLGTLRLHLSDIWPHCYVLPLFGLIGGLIAGLLVDRIAPEASGSGIPQVRARLDRIVMALDLRVALVKLLGGTMALGAGFFMGREGPTVQLGAALAAPLAHLLPTTNEHKRQLIAAGAGAGLTAAFNAPLAGVTFVLEELLKEVKPATVLIVIVACSVSSFVVNTLWPPHLHATASALNSVISFAPRDVPFYLLLGLVAGGAGAIFNRTILVALRFNRDVLQIPVTARIAIAGLASGSLMSLLPEHFHNYAGMRALIIAGETDWQMVLLALFAFFALTLVAYGSGAPGGLFAPSLALGAAIGYLIGMVEQLVTGTSSNAAFALVGMGAFFSAVARTPLTAIVITFELTTNFTLLTPLMFACMISSATAEFIFSGGLYDHLMRWNGIHLRGPKSSENLLQLKARDIMNHDFSAVAGSVSVRELLPLINKSAQRGFVVVDQGKLIGVVTQSDLSSLIGSDAAETATVSAIMTPHPVAINVHDTLDDILFLFSQFKFTWLPVTHHDTVMGVIRQSDVLQALFEAESSSNEDK